jgi:hypothetical protein
LSFSVLHYFSSDHGSLGVVGEKYAGEEKDLGDVMEDFLIHKQQSTSTPVRPQHMQPDVGSVEQEMLQDVTEQLERLETMSPSAVTAVFTHKQGTILHHRL